MSIETMNRDLMRSAVLRHLRGMVHTTLTLSVRVHAYGESALKDLHQHLCAMADDGLIVRMSWKGIYAPKQGEEYQLECWAIPRKFSPWQKWWRDLRNRTNSER